MRPQIVVIDANNMAHVDYLRMLVRRVRACKRFRCRPSPMYPNCQRSGVYAKLLRPCSKALGFTVMRYKSVTPSISHLLFTRSPAAVLWCVVSIVIDTVNGMTCGRRVTHILVEVLERGKPAAADFDSATSVAAVNGASWISAPLFHGGPFLIHSGRSFSVDSYCGNLPLAAKTPTTTRGAAPKTVSSYVEFRPAIADAEPVNNDAIASFSTDVKLVSYFKSSESLACYVFEILASFRSILNFSHGRNLLHRLRLWLGPVEDSYSATGSLYLYRVGSDKYKQKKGGPYY